MTHSSRRQWLIAAAATASCHQAPGKRIGELSLAELPHAVSAQDAARHYLMRIAEVDRVLHAVIEVNPDAMRIAAERDAERSRPGKVLGRLHGVPILIKDNIDTADRMMTTAGSLALVGAPTPRQDAGLVAQLRAAGAVILGKTNLSEWANIRSSRSTSGWSGRGGQTHNPHALDRNPSGSSSGSGAAVAASLCAAAVGTETDGSIVSPAANNGIVGIKPTLGLVSGQGIIPIAHSQDTAGPMARTVADAALLLSVLSGGTDFTGALKSDALRGARLGVARGYFGRHSDIQRLMEATLLALRNAGAVLVDPVELPPDSDYGDAEFEVLLYELKADLNAYLSARGGPIRSLADAIAFNEREAAREMPHFGQETFIKAQALGPLSDKAYRAAREKCKRAGAGIDAAMDKQGLAALIAPTDGPPWLTDYIAGDHFTQSCSTPAAVSGYPHITVPAGFVSGLPIGLSFFGRRHSDAVLIGLAHSFELATHARRAPRLIAHASA
jgi:amidase